jgi:hypothetical protein
MKVMSSRERERERKRETGQRIWRIREEVSAAEALMQ